MKKFLLISTSVLIAAMLAAGCAKKKSPSAAAVPVLVAKAMATNVPVQIQPFPVGHVVAKSTVNVRAQIGGKLQEVHFQEGQEVNKGDLLFTIDPRPAEAALESARAALKRDEAQLENAKVQFARDEQLYKTKVESQDQFDTGKAAFDSAAATVQASRASLTNALLNVEFTEIRAPISGRIGSLQFHAGNVVKAPDDILVTINQIHPIDVQFTVAEQFLPEIQRQMRAGKLHAEALFENMDTNAPQGELTFVDNTVDTATGTIQLKATFPNENSVLWPGQFVHVQLTLTEITNAVVVPTHAIQTGQNGEFIYVVKPDQTAEERPVTIGIAYGGVTVVQKGLRAGETVVTDGQLRLAPGVKVAVKSAGTVSTNSMDEME